MLAYRTSFHQCEPIAYGSWQLVIFVEPRWCAPTFLAGPVVDVLLLLALCIQVYKSYAMERLLSSKKAMDRDMSR